LFGRSYQKTKFKDFFTKIEGLSRTVSLFKDLQDLENMEKKTLIDFQERQRELM